MIDCHFSQSSESSSGFFGSIPLNHQIDPDDVSMTSESESSNLGEDFDYSHRQLQNSNMLLEVLRLDVRNHFQVSNGIPSDTILREKMIEALDLAGSCLPKPPGKNRKRTSASLSANAEALDPGVSFEQMKSQKNHGLYIHFHRQASCIIVVPSIVNVNFVQSNGVFFLGIYVL